MIDIRRLTQPFPRYPVYKTHKTTYHYEKTQKTVMTTRHKDLGIALAISLPAINGILPHTLRAPHGVFYLAMLAALLLPLLLSWALKAKPYFLSAIALTANANMLFWLLAADSAWLTQLRQEAGSLGGFLADFYGCVLTGWGLGWLAGLWLQRRAATAKGAFWRGFAATFAGSVLGIAILTLITNRT